MPLDRSNYLLALKTAIDLVEIWRYICCIRELQKESAESLDHRHLNDLVLFSPGGLREDFFLALVLLPFRRPRLDG